MIFFIDIEAVRFAVIQGGTNSPTFATMCRVLASLHQGQCSCNWVERVPSASNPADAPWRGDAKTAAELFETKLKPWPSIRGRSSSRGNHAGA